MATFTASPLYPSPSPTSLQLQYIGKPLSSIQPPPAILDLAVLRRNCTLMLQATAQLGVGFRAHVKTHKTVEVTELQVGKDTQSIKLVASTVAEIEHLLPWLQKCKGEGKEVNIIYGLPVAPSAIPRLAAISQILGSGSVGLFVDHPDHIKFLDQVEESSWPGKIPVWTNIDVGYHREGVPADSKQLADTARALKASKRVELAGLYTHLGSSYGSSSPEEALKFMADELRGLEEGAVAFLAVTGAEVQEKGKVTLSLGASPTATSLQNLLHETDGGKEYLSMIEKIKQSFDVEFHAGVFPIQDMQQLATRARPTQSLSNPEQSLLSHKDLAMRILAEVSSVYPDRGEQPEVLIAAGCIVFGREPCKSYPGWGVVTPWPAKDGQFYDPEGSKTGWIVGRVSQEHGNLTWEGPQDNIRHLAIGEKVLVWPNHSCIASVNFGWYLIVDSDKPDPDRIEDVWIRCRGW